MTDAIVNDRIIWTDDFLIGIDELDYEHRGLIGDINKLHLELSEEADQERVDDTLGSIYARLQAHFALEEHVMAARNYTHFHEHKAEHDLLVDQYLENMIEFQRDRTPARLEALEIVLQKWIVNHILVSDKKMSSMIAGGSTA